MLHRELFFGSGTDTTPDQFTFTDVSGVNPSTVTTSGMVTVTGLAPNFAVNVTASGGTVDAGTSALSGTFASSKAVTTSATGTFVMAARATSSASFSTAVDVVVTVNDVSDTFTVTTRDADTTPNAFTFTDQTSVERNSYCSTSIVPTGYDTASWSVSGGEGSTNNSTWSASGTITSGQTFYIRLVSSGSFSTTVSATATIGGVSDTWNVTTRSVDATPDAFSFTNVTGASLSTVYTSNTVTVTGLEPNVGVTVSGSGGTIDAGTTSLSGNFAASKTVNASASGSIVVAARVTSSGSYSTVVNCSVTVGNGSATYTVTTAAADTTPDAFSFSDVTGATLNTVYTSNTVTVSGMSPGVSITVTASGGTVDAGTTSLSGTFASSKTVTTSASGTIVVAARVTSSSSGSTAVNCVVNISGVTDTYSVTTGIYGEAVYTTAGTYDWTVPTGVTSICILGITGGGSGGNGYYNGAMQLSGTAGTGGSLGYTNNVSVTPGETIRVTVGAGGVRPSTNNATGRVGTAGGHTTFLRVSTGLLIMQVLYNYPSTTQGGAGYTSENLYAAGGGGAGGYTGVGGSGGYAAANNGTAGQGGGGGGGASGGRSAGGCGGGGGGGVGLYGSGNNGSRGTFSTSNVGGGGGGGGSSGTSGASGEAANLTTNKGGAGGAGGSYGGGGGAGSGPTTSGASSTLGNFGGNGGGGAARIIWGAGRSFPSNAT